MVKSNGMHLSKENREVIEDGLRDSDSARKIAKRINVSASTVTREVKTNRTIKDSKSSSFAKLSTRCAKHKDCQAAGSACEKCINKLTACKSCRSRSCIEHCPDFVRTMCPTCEKWPYVCPASCSKKAHCGYPKCSYKASDANCLYTERLKSSREGIAISAE